jgi:hypothetical protein
MTNLNPICQKIEDFIDKVDIALDIFYEIHMPCISSGLNRTIHLNTKEEKETFLKQYINELIHIDMEIKTYFDNLPYMKSMNFYAYYLEAKTYLDIPLAQIQGDNNACDSQTILNNIQSMMDNIETMNI